MYVHQFPLSMGMGLCSGGPSGRRSPDIKMPFLQMANFRRLLFKNADIDQDPPENPPKDWRLKCNSLLSDGKVNKCAWAVTYNFFIPFNNFVTIIHWRLGEWSISQDEVGGIFAVIRWAWDE